MTEAIRSSETSILTTATRRHIAEDGILHSDNREKPQILLGLGLLNKLFTCHVSIRQQTNPVAFNPKRTIPTERPPLTN
jgi:hypothetical protein